MAGITIRGLSKSFDAREGEVRVWEKKGTGTTRIDSARIRRVALSGRDPTHTVAAN